MVPRVPGADHPWRGQYRAPASRPVVATERACGRCGETKPLDAAHFSPRGKGFRGVCRACRNAERPANPAPPSPEARAAKRRRNHAQQLRRWRVSGLTLPPASWWTLVRASVELGLSREMTCRLVRRGTLRGLKRGTRDWRVDPTSVREELARRTLPTTTLACNK